MRGVKGTGWTVGTTKNRQAHCRSCLKDVHSRPSENCKEPKHLEVYLRHKDRANSNYTVKFKNQIAFRQWQKRIAVIEKLGGCCVVCGETDIRVLQINHKDGNRDKDFPEGCHNVNKFYNDILSGKRDISDLDCRCANHNILYEYELGRRTLVTERPSVATLDAL